MQSAPEAIQPLAPDGVRGRLFEPSLLWRTTGSVLVAFVMVFTVLLAYFYVQARQTVDNGESGLRRFAEAVLLSLDSLDDPARARDALGVTAGWVNIRRQQIGRLPGVVLYELRGADGEAVYVSPALQGLELPGETPGMREVQVGGEPHRAYLARSPKWTLRVVEPWRTTSDILRYNASYILRYLLMSLPFVLLPVWLSARNGLRPLQQFADHIAQRNAADLRPVGLQVRHRELKPLTQALDTLFCKLREKIDRERGFVQDAAHELRTPLAVITAQAHVLARSEDSGERNAAHENLNHAISRASHLARQLLVLASLDDAQQRAVRRIDVAQAVRQLLAQAAPAAMERGIDLSLEAPDKLWCAIDEPALESIVFNLVDNAVRYGKPAGAVTVRLDGDEERLELQVRDDGPGIAPGELELVFERFYRGVGHDMPGSGLGLSIVRQAAARLKGHVTVTQGVKGAGVGFTVSIPVPGFMPG
jgi:two-component system, OmpR family, sensor histidine kinase QseC